MSLSNSVVYLIAALLIVVALAIVLPRRGHSFRARDIHGNTFVGNINAKNRPDKIAWIIAIIGVLVALAQLGHDLFTK